MIDRLVAATVLPSWYYRAWQTDEGLPDNSVTGVTQTSDGYLWVATYGGLLRFNGVSFTQIPFSGLYKKSVRTFLLDRAGRFWLGMDPGSVICLGGKSSRTYTAVDGISAERIVAMAEDGDGSIWIIYSTVVCKIQDGRVSVLTVSDGLPSGLNPWIASDSKGNIWFAKGGQVGMINGNKIIPRLNFKDTVIRICRTAASGVWICSGSRLLKYDGSHDPVEYAQLPVNCESQVLYEDHSGALWIGTASDGLFKFENGKLEKIPTSHQSVNSLYEDSEGNIWVGTRGGGLNRILPSAVELLGRESGLPFEAVASVCEDSQGIIWVASQSGILSYYKEGKWNSVGSDSGWRGDAATCVAADKNGGIWVGSRNRMLCNLRDGVWQTWQRDNGLRGGSVHMIFIASNDDVWVVTGSPSRLQQLHDGKLGEPFAIPGSNRTIRAIAEGTDGTIWLGTLEGQILKVNSLTHLVEQVATEPNSVPVRTLETTADGALWIGYAGEGIGRLKNGKFSRVTEADGLTDDFASQMLSDGHGEMWVVGNRGLFQVSLDQMNAVMDHKTERLRPQVFGRNEGLPSFQPNSANFPSVCKGSDGHLWFALRSGLLTVQPDNIHRKQIPTPVVVERVSLDDKTVALYDSGTPLQTENGENFVDLMETNIEIRVPPIHKKVEMSFAELSYFSPENALFRYRLDNFDSDWIDASTQRSARYPHLSPGDYTFHLITGNQLDTWSETGRVIRLKVLPFFWQTWWFKGILLLCFTMCIVGIVRYVFFRRMRQRMMQLENQAVLDRERARIARDMHDEVGAKLTRLSLLSEMVGFQPDIPPSARVEVKEMSDTARETIRSFEEIVWAVNPSNDTLTDLVHYLCRYAEDYFEGSSAICVFDLPQEIPRIVLPPEVRHHVFLASKEALNNILKHANASRIKLQVTLGSGEFRIAIEDDGCGFSVSSPPKRVGGGNGLENMKERLRRIGGRLEYRSQPGQGTGIIFIAPDNYPKHV
jgi:signal transduction histidine kinase/ligand-binding sensor domain-containing protein